MDKNLDILKTFNKVKKMSYRQFEQFLHDYGYGSYEEGVEYGNKEAVTWFSEELVDALIAGGINEDDAILAVDIMLSKEKKDD